MDICLNSNSLFLHLLSVYDKIFVIACQYYSLYIYYMYNINIILIVNILGNKIMKQNAYKVFAKIYNICHIN
jgi:hypothetical protein